MTPEHVVQNYTKHLNTLYRITWNTQTRCTELHETHKHVVQNYMKHLNTLYRITWNTQTRCTELHETHKHVVQNSVVRQVVHRSRNWLQRYKDSWSYSSISPYVQFVFVTFSLIKSKQAFYLHLNSPRLYQQLLAFTYLFTVQKGRSRFQGRKIHL